jgi:hypothetical protein
VTDLIFLVRIAAFVLGAGCAFRGWNVLLRMNPALATVTDDGYREAQSRFDAAFARHHAPPMPLRIADRISFDGGSGNVVRADITRWCIPHDRMFTIWFDPDCPQRFTAIGPLRWFGLAIVAIGLSIYMSI